MTKRFWILCVCVILWAQTLAPASADDRLYNLQHGAYLLEEKKQYAKALEMLLQAVKMDPKDAWTHRHIGNDYRDLNRHKESLPYYQEAFRLDRADPMNAKTLSAAMVELKMYQPAIDVCEAYLKTHPKDKKCVDLWEIKAHALVAMKRYKEADEAFDHYFDLKPEDPNDWWRAGVKFEDPAAAPYLSSIFDEYRKRFPKHEGVAALAYDVRRYSQLARAEASADQVDEFESWIVYNDAKPKVSKIFYGAVKEGLRSIPESVWRPLADAEYVVLLTPHVSDIKGSETSKHPRGWRKGATFANIDGLFMPDRKAILVAELYRNEQGKEVTNEDPCGTVCHELGHAYDDYLGSIYGGKGGDADSTDFSHGALFSAAYRKDAATLTPAARKRLEYFVQAEGHAGQEELFAELFPIIFNKSDYVGSEDELLRKSFPNSFALMTKLLNVGKSAATAAAGKAPLSTTTTAPATAPATTSGE